MAWRLILISVLTLFTISPARPSLLSADDLVAAAPAREVFTWRVLPSLPATSMDLGSSSHCLFLEGQTVRIAPCASPDGESFWQSGESWQVTEALSGDLDRDGRRELVLLVWRPFKPWPVDVFLPHGGRIDAFHDRRGFSCHVILVGWDGRKYRELWAGSALKDPLRGLRIADLDGDGFDELIALEGTYDARSPSGDLVIWQWSGFGFSLLKRISGSFSQFGIVFDTERVYLLTN